MATREEYLSIAEQALQEGDEATAMAAMDEAEKLQPASKRPEEKSLLQQAGDVAMDYAVNPALEGMAAVNRGATGIVDFFASPVNAAMELSGSDVRVPSLTKALEPYATGGNFMEPGLYRDIVRGAGEAVPASVAIGAGLRAAAQQLPAIASGAESVGAGVLRQMGNTNVLADAGYGALSGAGAVAGKEAGGETGAMIGAIAAPAAVTIAPQLAGEAIKKIFAGGNQQAIAKSIDDFAFIGETPTVGMATGSPALQKTETVSGSVMGGGRLRANRNLLLKTFKSA